MTGGSGKLKKIDPEDLVKLTNGQKIIDSESDPNLGFAQKYGLTVTGKVNGKSTALTQKGNFNFVVTTNTTGGMAYITAVGVDGGIYGGGDVLAKKPISKAVGK